MKVIPAIDLVGGRVARLRQGDMARATFYATSPEAQVEAFVAAGAKRVHIVDLDAAVEGRAQSPVALAALGRARALGVEAQIGGGLRDLAAVETALAAGASYALIGTGAARDEGALLRDACARFPGSVLAAVDARDGRVAVAGWREEAACLSPLALAARCQALGAAGVAYTAVARDGMGAGVDTQTARAFVAALEVPVLLAGGARSLDDVRAARDAGLDGLIIGRALYEGGLTLAEALAAC